MIKRYRRPCSGARHRWHYTYWQDTRDHPPGPLTPVQPVPRSNFNGSISNHPPQSPNHPLGQRAFLLAISTWSSPPTPSLHPLRIRLSTQSNRDLTISALGRRIKPPVENLYLSYIFESFPEVVTIASAFHYFFSSFLSLLPYTWMKPICTSCRFSSLSWHKTTTLTCSHRKLCFRELSTLPSGLFLGHIFSVGASVFSNIYQWIINVR